MLTAGRLSVTEFKLNDEYDHLTVKGVKYSNNSGGPDGVDVEVGDQIRWKTGNSGTDKGFMICMEDTNAPTRNPTASPTDAPTASPTVAPTASPTDAPTASPTASPTAYVFSAAAQAQITESLLESLASPECNPTNCLDWNCEQWCECFNLDFEVANYYADMGCDQEDGDSSCECK